MEDEFADMGDMDEGAFEDEDAPDFTD